MRVAIAGFGQEGAISYDYWGKLGAEVTIFDTKEVPAYPVPAGAASVLQVDAFSQLNGYDLVIRTPGLNPNKIKTDGRIWSATNEFFDKCPCPIIGVTGTKGKGTTCTLITRILEAAGQTVHLVGNIGVPALEVLPSIDANDIVVFELSSFQLWDIKKSAHTAIILMIEPDHLDVHADMAEYVKAKANITKFQGPQDVLIYHPTNEFVAAVADSSPAGTKLKYLTNQGAYIDSGEIVIADQHICKTADVGLIGPHNLENICAAITAAWLYTQDVAAIQKAVTTFKGLPHRLELVRAVNGVSYYDDSYATGSGATLAALKSFDMPTVIILGGSDKGVDISSVLSYLDPKRHFAVLIGQSTKTIATQLLERNFEAFIALGETVAMAEIIEAARKHAVHGGVVLLSPAHASFGMFKNYQDRGDQFKRAVERL